MSTFKANVLVSNDAFEKLYQASPIAKIMEEQSIKEKAVRRGNFLSSTSSCQGGGLGSKAQLLRRMQRSRPDTSKNQEYNNGSFNYTDLSSSAGSLNGSDSLDVTLIESDKGIPLKPGVNNWEAYPGLGFRASTPTLRPLTNHSVVTTPVLKENIDSIVAQLGSDSEDECVGVNTNFKRPSLNWNSRTTNVPEHQHKSNQGRDKNTCKQTSGSYFTANMNSKDSYTGKSIQISTNKFQECGNTLPTKWNSRVMSQQQQSSLVEKRERSYTAEYTDQIQNDKHRPVIIETNDLSQRRLLESDLRPIEGPVLSEQKCLQEEHCEGKNDVQLNEIQTEPHKVAVQNLGKTMVNPEARSSSVVDISEDLKHTAMTDPQISNRNPGGKKPLRTQEHLLDQWIIKPLPACKGVFVEGHRRGDAEETFWHSSAIATRRDSRTVLTASGSVYKLVGSIEETYALDAGFSLTVIRAFSDGFPEDWKEVLEEFFTKKAKRPPKKAKMNKTLIESKHNNPLVKQRTRKSEPPVVTTQYSTPVLPKLDDLPKTRSGRMVKPQLAWWAGQRVRINNKTGQVEITAVESPALDVSFDNIVSKQAKYSLSLSLSTSSTPRTVVSKKNSSGNSLQHKETLKRRSKLGKEPVVVLKDLKVGMKENLKKNVGENKERSTKSGAKAEEIVDLQSEVLNVLVEHKQRRLSKQESGRNKTCYNSDKMRSSSVKNKETAGSSESESEESVAKTFGSKVEQSIRRQVRKTTDHPRRNSKLEANIECTTEPSTTDSSETEIEKTCRRPPRQNKSEAKIDFAPEKKSSSVSKCGDVDRQKLTRRTRSRSCHPVWESQDNSSDDNKIVGRVTRSASRAERKGKKVLPCKHVLPFRPAQEQYSDSSDGDSDYIPGKSKARSRASKTSKRCRKKKEKVNTEIKSTSENNKPWTKKELDALNRAVQMHSPDNPHFWQQVAGTVFTRSEEECRDYYFQSASSIKQPASRKAKHAPAKQSQPVTLSGRVGTLKRKRELRDMMDQYNDGYEDDFFDATPMRKKTYKAPVVEEEDDIFGDKLPFDTPALSRTPFLRNHLALVSPTKTPYMGGESPGFQSPVNRNDVDRYIHRLKKRRKITKDCNTEKEPEEKSVLAEYTDDLFSKEKQQSDEDSEEEKDFYWSDA